MNEYELINGIQKGLEQSFTFAFKELYPSLSFFAFKITHNQTAAEDIAQEAFVKVWQKRQQFSKWDSLKTYLYTIVKNDGINWTKRNGIEIRIKDELSKRTITDERYIFESLVQAETYKELSTSIEKLSPQTRTILKMFYYENRKISEIAKILGISRSTVKTLQYRGLIKLKGNIGFIILYFLHHQCSLIRVFTHVSERVSA